MKQMIRLLWLSIVIAGVAFAGRAEAVTLQMTSSPTKIKSGQSMTVDIIADSAAGLSGAVLTVTYPAEALTLDLIPVTTDYFSPDLWQFDTATPGKIFLAGLTMDAGGAGTTLFSVHFVANVNVPSGSYSLSLEQTSLCTGPAGWGTDANNNGMFDEGDEYEAVPLLYTVSYQQETQHLVTEILLESFTQNPQVAFRVQGGKSKDSSAAYAETGASGSEALPLESSNLVELKHPPENEFGVSVDPYLEVALMPDITIPDSSRMLWQIGKDLDFAELIFVTATSLDQSNVQVPTLVLDPQTTYYWRVNGIDADSQAESWSTPATFTTGTGDAPDLNGNGIPDHQDIGAYENLIKSAFPDISEVGIKIFKDNSGENQFAIGPGKGVLLINRAKWENPEDTQIPDKTSIAYPLGLIAFHLYATLPGETVALSLYYATPITPGSKWRNYDPQNGWFNASPSNAVVGKDYKTVELSLTDGGDGDADGVANGVVVCIGGPSVRSK